MIAFLSGKLVDALPTQITVEVNGVGYEVLIPVSSFARLPEKGRDVHILTHLVVREDAHILYGFVSPAERELFRLLINTVSGVGPRIALNVLSGMSPSVFRRVVAAGDVRALSQINGVGRKTAERIVVELRERIGTSDICHTAVEQDSLSEDDKRFGDTVLALVALGFKQSEAGEAARSALVMLGDTATVEDIVRACLKKGS